MAARQEVVPVQLPDGVKMHVEATMLGGEEEVAFEMLAFDQITETIASIAEAVTGAIQKVKPTKAGVEFGLAIALESGKLTTLLVKGSVKGCV